jgi:cell division protein FtsA
VEPYALSIGISGVKAPNHGAIIIDVGGGTTDVALVKNGSIIGTKMFAIGGQVFTKRIQKVLGLDDFGKAENIKLDYSNSKVDSNTESTISKALARDIKTWLTGVELSLEEFNELIFTCES